MEIQRQALGDNVTVTMVQRAAERWSAEAGLGHDDRQAQEAYGKLASGMHEMANAVANPNKILAAIAEARKAVKTPDGVKRLDAIEAFYVNLGLPVVEQATAFLKSKE